MCGIVGFVNADASPANRALLERMNAAIRHRGPDEDGYLCEGGVALAMQRLAIIDLAGGQQPIYNADKTKWIVFNGEIYNYRDLRKDLESRGHQLFTNSDTEAILRLYEDFGADCVQHLRGMFAFAIWDSVERSLFIARDRVGKKPLLYSHRLNGDLVFGSEFTALLEHPAVSREIDHQAIDAYLSFTCVPAPMTAYKEIRKLEPGHWLRWRNGEIKTRRYWSPDFSKKIDISEEEAIEETTRLLRESTRLRMISEVPLGAFLSGGVDSSVVVALMAQESSTPVKTFSIGFDDEEYSELKYARRVAEHVGAEHHEFVVKPDALEILPTLVEHYGEPYADSSAVPTYYVARETRKHVTVALNGDGGDESFAGYERYVAMRMAESYRKIPGFLRKPFLEFPVSLLPTSEVRRSRVRDAQRFFRSASMPRVERYLQLNSAFDRAAKSELYTRDFAAELNGHDAAEVLGKWFKTANGSGIIDTTMMVDQMTYLPNDLLVKVDIASMANSLEARSPFLDHNVIEFAAKLPESLKLNGADTKSFLKKVAARLVPREVIYRRKMGFGVPVGKWFRSEMKDFVREVLLSEKSLNRGVIRPEAIRRYVDEHTEARQDHSFRLWTLLMLELWFRRFID
jgi:asparagine synthase (glutamine-hydrolysing)